MVHTYVTLVYINPFATTTVFHSAYGYRLSLSVLLGGFNVFIFDSILYNTYSWSPPQFYPTHHFSSGRPNQIVRGSYSLSTLLIHLLRGNVSTYNQIWWTMGESNSQLKLAKLSLSHLTNGPIWLPMSESNRLSPDYEPGNDFPFHSSAILIWRRVRDSNS